MIRILAVIAILLSISFTAVQHFTGDWTLAWYTLVIVGVFCAGLLWYTTKSRRGVQNVHKAKPNSAIHSFARSIDNKYQDAREADELKVAFNNFLREDLDKPLSSMNELLSLIERGAYGKLSPAVEEALRQVAEKSTQMKVALEEYSARQASERLSKGEPKRASIRSLEVISHDEAVA